MIRRKTILWESLIHSDTGLCHEAASLQEFSASHCSLFVKNKNSIPMRKNMSPIIRVIILSPRPCFFSPAFILHKNAFYHPTVFIIICSYLKKKRDNSLFFNKTPVPGQQARGYGDLMYANRQILRAAESPLAAGYQWPASVSYQQRSSNPPVWG